MGSPARPLLTSLATAEASSRPVDADGCTKALARSVRGLATTHVLYKQTGRSLDTTRGGLDGHRRPS